MESQFIVSKIEKFAVVEFQQPSLMDPLVLESIQSDLDKLVTEQDQRRVILDFEKVEYLSSQAIGIVLSLRKKLAALPHSVLVLCGVGPKLMELLKIIRLDKVLTIRPTQHEAVKVLPP